MDKKVTKNDIIKDIRKYFNELGIPKGGSVAINKIMDSIKIIFSDHSYVRETKVVSVTRNKVIVESYKNGELELEYSKEYPLGNVNVSYFIVWGIKCELWRMIREKAA